MNLIKNCTNINPQGRVAKNRRYKNFTHLYCKRVIRRLDKQRPRLSFWTCDIYSSMSAYSLRGKKTKYSIISLCLEVIAYRLINKCQVTRRAMEWKRQLFVIVSASQYTRVGGVRYQTFIMLNLKHVQYFYYVTHTKGIY